MLHSAVIPVHRHPVVQCLLAGQDFLILGIRVPEEIPGRACPLGHGIRLPLCRASAAGTGGVHPLRHGSQRRFPVVRGLVGFHIRKHQRQLALVQGNKTAFFTLHNGNWLSPVTLPGKHPVPELEIGLALSQALLLQPGRDLLFGICHGKAVQKIGIHQSSGLHIRVHCLLDAYRASRHHFYDGKVEFRGKVPVPLVVGGHCHDGTGSVGHQHIIGDPDGNLFSVHRIGGGKPLNLHACLLLHKLRALKVGFLRGLLPVSHQSVIIPDLLLIFLNQGMLRGDHHIGCPEKGVRPGGIDAEFLPFSGDGEIHLRALGFADPVLLGHFDSLDVVYRIQALEQLIRILCNLQHPLTLHLADHLCPAALADAVHHFLIGQAHLTGSTPVDGHLALVGQTCLEKLQEDPLGPFVIAGVRGIHLPLPVKGIAQGVKLSLEPLHIVFGHDSGMDMVLDSVVLRGQAEGVPAHGIQYIIALHPALSGHNVQCRVRSGVAHMESLSRRIGKLYKRIVFRFRIIVGCPEGLFPVPDSLPFLFHLMVVVRLCHVFSSCSDF